jgi:hypothetical protein
LEGGRRRLEMPLLYGKGFDPLYEKRKSTIAAGGGGGGAETSLQSMQEKYLSQMPKANIPSDPDKIYGSMMGPARQDVNRATEQIGLGLQKHATGGSSYEDMLSRYLPGAIEPMADMASRSATASQEFAQKGAVAQGQADMQRVSYANEMAATEKNMQNEQRRFMLDLKARVSMAEREIAAKMRIAQSQARSQEHLARINNNAAMERQRVLVNAQQETQRFGQTQENYRNNVRMQVYDKWYTGNLQHQERQDALDAGRFKSRYGTQPKTEQPRVGQPRPGTGSYQFGTGPDARSGSFGGGGFQDTQAYPGMTSNEGYYGPPQDSSQFYGSRETGGFGYGGNPDARNLFNYDPMTQQQKDERFRSLWR